MRQSLNVYAKVYGAVTLALATLFTIARFNAMHTPKVKLWFDY
jgi:hypothetical protein